MSIRILNSFILIVLLLVTPVFAQEEAAPASGADHVAAIKQALQQNAAALHEYQWVETTAVSMKGEEKSRTQNDCSYGADGQVQKTPVAAAAEPADNSRRKKRVKGKVVEKKKAEISASMQEALALVKQYVPPDPARIQAAKEAGTLSVSPPDPQGHVQMVIKDYLKAGDSLSIDLNAATSLISGVTISSYTDSAKDAVGLKVSYATLPDGTSYPATTQLEVAAEKMSVAIENSGYEKAGS